MFEKALPKIPALSNAETATHVCFFLELTIFGKNKEPATAPPSKLEEIDVFINFLLFINKYSGGRNRVRTCDLLRVEQLLSQLSYPPNLMNILLKTLTNKKNGILFAVISHVFNNSNWTRSRK